MKATGAAIIFWLGATGWTLVEVPRSDPGARARRVASAAVEGTGAEGDGRPAGAPANGAANGVVTGNGNGNGRGVGTGGTDS